MAGTRWPTAVDLFSGCGGVTEGLKKARFRVVAAVDNDPVACSTYRRNHRHVRLYEKDIRSPRLPEEILNGPLHSESPDLMTVCAPCQPFSRQNRKRAGDDRDVLVLEAVTFAKVLKPKVIFFENVPGLDDSEVFAELVKGLEGLGYTMGKDPRVIDAADHGVPQRRVRFAALAWLPGHEVKLPPASTPVGQRVTVRHALRGLKMIGHGKAHESDVLHRSPKHKPIVLKRLRHIPRDGGSRDSLPDALVLACHREHDGHRDVYGRMKWDDVAPTITTGCTNVTRGRFAHPLRSRAITLREAARLQTFDDDYRFDGNAGQIATQIGNAVPVQLMWAIAKHLRPKVRSSGAPPRHTDIPGAEGESLP